MSWRCFLTAFVAVGSLHASAAIANIECDTFYEVGRGDTLSKISRRVYGDYDAEFLYQVNRETIGRDPSLIEIGLRIWIPCREAAATAAAAAVLAPPAPSRNAGAALRVLSGPPRPPLIGPDLPATGMMTEMLSAIADGAGFNLEAPVHVRASGPRLASLLVNGGFDIGFPWTRGDCAEGDRNPEQRRDCAELLFTEPFFEVEMGMFALRDGPYGRAETTADLRGARICRPATLTLDDLAEAGLIARAEIVRPADEAECLDRLAAGAVDVVSMDAELGEILLARAPIAGKATRLPVATRQMLYAAAPRLHPDAEAIVDAINRGLMRIRASGQWFAIAHRHLARYPKLVGRVQPRG